MSEQALQLSLLSPEEARRLTDEVKQDTAALWRKLLGLYKGRAHEALGYSSWGDYCGVEFDMAQSHSYRLLDAGRVVDALEEHSPIGEPANEAQARELAPLLREDESQIVDVWRELRDEYGAENVTAKKVRSLVGRRLERRRRQERLREEHAKQEARVVGPDGQELKFEQYVTYSSPRDELDHVRGLIVDGVDRLRDDIAATMPRQAVEAFCSGWMPYHPLRDALRGKRAVTMPPKSAVELLSPVYRDLFERQDVADALQAMDAALEVERAQFVDEFAAWIGERAGRIGETLEPHYEQLWVLVDSLPDTELESRRKARGRFVEAA